MMLGKNKKASVFKRVQIRQTTTPPCLLTTTTTTSIASLSFSIYFLLRLDQDFRWKKTAKKHSQNDVKIDAKLKR